MRYLALMTLLLCACAAEDKALARPSPARADQPAVAQGLSPELAAYRSQEILKDVPWGATPDEVVAKKGEPQERSGHSMTFVDSVVGAPVPVVFAFHEGHLAQTKTSFSGRPPSSLIEKGMQMRYGADAVAAESLVAFSVFGAEGVAPAFAVDHSVGWKTKESAIVLIVATGGGQAEVISSSLTLAPLLLAARTDAQKK